MNQPSGSPSPAARHAFVELLAQPLVTPANAPALHRDLTRNAAPVAAAARRLGYRVATVNRAIRLFRTPAAGTVATPPPPLHPPTRRTLAMVCILAAACEEAGAGATLAKLSDLVAELTTAPSSTVTAYDPGTLAHRRQLLRAAKELEHWGVLYRRTADDALLETWADQGTGIGAGYGIDRDALLLLTSPEILAIATRVQAPDTDDLASTRSLRALRALVELPAVLYADLDPEDAAALRTQRGLRTNEAVALTGGHVEARTEGLVLVFPDEPPASATVDWPRAQVGSWVALLAADLASREGRRDTNGAVHLTPDQVQSVCEDLRTWKNTYLSKDLRDNTAKIATTAQGHLTHLGLLRVTADGSWILSPVAGRYRDPEITYTTARTDQESP